MSGISFFLCERVSWQNMLIFLWWLSLTILSCQVSSLYYLFRDMCSMNLGPLLTTDAYSVMKSSVRVSAKAAVAWKLPHNTCVCQHDIASAWKPFWVLGAAATFPAAHSSLVGSYCCKLQSGVSISSRADSFWGWRDNSLFHRMRFPLQCFLQFKK